MCVIIFINKLELGHVDIRVEQRGLCVWVCLWGVISQRNQGHYAQYLPTALVPGFAINFLLEADILTRDIRE